MYILLSKLAISSFIAGTIAVAYWLLFELIHGDPPKRPSGLETMDLDDLNSEWSEYLAKWRKRNTLRKYMFRTIISGYVMALLCLISIPIFGSFLAGKGDAEIFAAKWVDKWETGAHFECQQRDIDDNGFITCTIGHEGEHPMAIECGVNRWYQGWHVTGCRLMKGFSGRQ